MTLSVRPVIGRSVCHDFLNMGEHSYIYTSIGKLVLNETLQNIYNCGALGCLCVSKENAFGIFLAPTYLITITMRHSGIHTWDAKKI